MAELNVKAKTNINRTRTAIWFAGYPGTPVYNWREAAMRASYLTALSIAPVNNPLNAIHRGGTVGTYLAGIRVNRTGNQYGRGFNLSATAPHSEIVESGRSASTAHQFFSWTHNTPPGAAYWRSRTGARDGHHVIERSIAAGLAITT